MALQVCAVVRRKLHMYSSANNCEVEQWLHCSVVSIVTELQAG